jgi:flagellin
MSVINTNISAGIAVNALIKNDREQETAMERLSTGLRINSAKDDAAGLAITERMKAEVTGLEMAARNANDAISMLETAEGSTREIASALQRMRELAVQAASGTYNDSDRVAMDLEFGELWTEIQRIATQTTWNTMTVLNGNDVTTKDVQATKINIQLGKSSSQTMELVIKSFDPRNTIDNEAVMQTLNPVRAFAGGTGTNENSGNAAGVTKDTSAFGTAVLFVGNGEVGEGVGEQPNTRIDIITSANATFSLTQLDVAITAVSAERAMYGSYIGRLQAAANNLTNVAQNQDQSRSRIEDTDYAVETSELSRTQIIAQASTAMLAQANQSKQTVLALLQ